MTTKWTHGTKKWKKTSEYVERAKVNKNRSFFDFESVEVETLSATDFQKQQRSYFFYTGNSPSRVEYFNTYIDTCEKCFPITFLF